MTHSRYASRNQFSGTLPLSWASRPWRRIQIDDNALTQGLPAAFGSLSELTSLRLRNNRLTGTVPSSLFSIAGLERLDYSGNSFTGPLVLPFAPELSFFGAAQNSLTGTLPAWVSSLTKLEMLDVSANMISGSVPELPSSAKGVFFFANELTGTLAFPSGTNLRAVLGHSNRFDGLEPDSWCSAAQVLDASMRCDLSSNLTVSYTHLTLPTNREV